MKVIFVGIHNKPGFKPLDSSTKSGKLIDGIITSLPDSVVCIKTNFYDRCHLPEPSKYDNKLWAERVGFNEDDLVIRLGQEVQKRMSGSGCRSIDLVHPGRIGYKEKYISESVELIRKYLIP